MGETYHQHSVVDRLYRQTQRTLVELKPNAKEHSATQLVSMEAFVGKYERTAAGNIVLVDKVLIPPKGNVIDVLALNGNLTRFVSLLKSAGLADELQAEG